MPIQAQTPSDQLIYTPLSLFNTKQHVYKNAPDHDAFARIIHREFSDLLCSRNAASSPQDQTLASLHSNPSPKRWPEFPRPSSSSRRNQPENGQSFGGIMVSQSVIVDVAEARPGADVEMQTLGTVGQAMKEEGDVVTFVNELFAACVADG